LLVDFAGVATEAHTHGRSNLLYEDYCCVHELKIS